MTVVVANRKEAVGFLYKVNRIAVNLTSHGGSYYGVFTKAALLKVWKRHPDFAPWGRWYVHK